MPAYMAAQATVTKPEQFTEYAQRIITPWRYSPAAGRSMP